jgi:aquaporin Z
MSCFMLSTVAPHWPEYFIEAALLGMFMLSACATVVVVHHPASPFAARFRNGRAKRLVVGIAMGVTAIALIYSPLGGRSGAHMNPSVTIAFLFLDKISLLDGVMYIAFQCVGGIVGLLIARGLFRRAVSHASVNYVATSPGASGKGVAWLAEFAIAFLMMTTVLASNNYAGTAPYTGMFAGLLVMLFITFEAPLSGMSLNPARTLASAVWARSYKGLWIYFTAPPLAMLLAASLYSSLIGQAHCAKLDHRAHHPCIFRCHFDGLEVNRETP